MERRKYVTAAQCFQLNYNMMFSVRFLYVSYDFGKLTYFLDDSSCFFHYASAIANL